VGGTAVGGTAVGAGVAAGPQALSSMEASTSIDTMVRILFITFSLG